MSLGAKTRFRSSISAGGLIWIALTNAFAIILSVGLLVPWAKIRMTRYLAGHTAIDTLASPDEFVGAGILAGSATGDAYADIEGVDVGLPI